MVDPPRVMMVIIIVIATTSGGRPDCKVLFDGGVEVGFAVVDEVGLGVEVAVWVVGAGVEV
jgi:hypothetical protein